MGFGLYLNELQLFFREENAIQVSQCMSNVGPKIWRKISRTSIFKIVCKTFTLKKIVKENQQGNFV